ncbi:hypothetical protein MMC24_006428 [Lignoscripta atroalba]|nr:hypothetical protein [Lignoscripta atroalba]
MTPVTAAGVSQLTEKPNRPTRPNRPNYNVIHALPLPVKVHSLPPLIPNNPLSLLHIAVIYVAQLLFPPSSHPLVKFKGHFSPETRSVHITDEGAIRALWEKGFFGKGNLSRSEPSWLDREKRRKGIVVGETSEEVTKRRREERREFKKERARKERVAIEEKLREESEAQVDENANTQSHAHTPIYVHEETNNHIPSLSKPQVSASHSIGVVSTNVVGELETPTKDEKSEPSAGHSRRNSPRPIVPSNGDTAMNLENEEHLQLTFEESFFLAYGLGVLDICEQSSGESMSTDSLFLFCRQYSYFPQCALEDIQPDDPFMLSYVVYHHFRSLGWVVRPGVKFAVDYLLYNRGPVFSHAEFAVIILPSYRHPYWSATPGRAAETQQKERKSWVWLHCVNRVQSQVRKSLILVYVEVPPPPTGCYPADLSSQNRLPSTASPTVASPNVALAWSLLAAKGSDAEGKTSAKKSLNVSQTLKMYSVREMTLKRWIPNRSRD